MSQTIFQVDAFTDKPYTGNPAGVCLLDAAKSEGWMQAVAAEMNVAETAFLVRQGADDFQLRWFTPTTEVDLCGHATLASAHVLWQEEVLNQAAQARFHTLSGVLTAAQRGAWIEMNFPAEAPAPLAAVPAELIDALGVDPRAVNYTGKNRLDYIIELDTEDRLRGLKPDVRLLSTLAARGVIVTSQSSAGEYDFVSRYFAPAFGIPEDPATGSAHCCLGPHWQTRLSKDKFVAYQASARGGTVRVQVKGERVLLGGQAVTTLRGQLLFAS